MRERKVYYSVELHNVDLVVFCFNRTPGRCCFSSFHRQRRHRGAIINIIFRGEKKWKKNENTTLTVFKIPVTDFNGVCTPPTGPPDDNDFIIKRDWSGMDGGEGAEWTRR